MNKVLYAPILKVMEDRKNFVDGNYQTAQENDAKAKEFSGQKDSLISNARETAKDKFNEKVEEYKNKKSDIVTDAQSSAKEELEKSEIELAQVSNEVKESLKGSMTDLANDIIEKVIGYRSEVESFDNQKIDEILYR